MVAIEGGNTKIVKKIIDASYTSPDRTKFEKRLKTKDRYGNTPLHLAFKNFNKEISEALASKPEYRTLDDRNKRGLVPFEMNHKKIKLDVQTNMKYDDIADYLMLVDSKRSNFLKHQLELLKLHVKSYPCTTYLPNFYRVIKRELRYLNYLLP